MTAIVTGLPLTGKVFLLILWPRTKCSIRFLSNFNLAQKKKRYGSDVGSLKLACVTTWKIV